MLPVYKSLQQNTPARMRHVFAYVALFCTTVYGFVGIAVALMGRNHPLGIILAALLFGALYQGGAELSFDIPTVTRDMVVVIQGLVILFSGAMEHVFRPHIVAVYMRLRGYVAVPAPAE